MKGSEVIKLLHSYKNGNYNVSIYDDGTKVRETEDDEFIADFPENIDIKISNKCDLGCPMCHENSTKDGENAKFNQEFLWSLRKGTELAIGGGNVLENPNLIGFLAFCKRRGIIANLTINLSHAHDWYNGEFTLDEIISRDLVNGIGISYNGNAWELEEYYSNLTKVYSWERGCSPLRKKAFNNTVIHVINGVQSFDDLSAIASTDRKILILGYKDVRRGIGYRKENDEAIKSNQKSIYNNLDKILTMFKVVSFDNLAIEQLDVKRLLPQEKWEEFYMGDDGMHTMYIDLVKEKFSLNSCDTKNRYDLLPTIDEMFAVVKGMKK